MSFSTHETLGPRGPRFFVVGCPRSGTTMLRLMLDSHPKIAVPPESHFVVGLCRHRHARRRDYGRLADLLETHPSYKRWGIPKGLARTTVEARHPQSYTEFIQCVFDIYADLEDKPLCGDKTPGYVEHLELLAGLFPSSRFIHIIRHGYDVAVSLNRSQWGPNSAVSGAAWWRTKVSRGREAGATLGSDRYREIRYEDLVTDPPGTLRSLCGFIQVSYTVEMLDWPARTARKYPGFKGTRLVEPPAFRDRWQGPELTRWETAAVRAVCAPLLRDLGYRKEPTPPTGAVAARVLRSRDLVLDSRRTLADRMRPRKRQY